MAAVIAWAGCTAAQAPPQQTGTRFVRIATGSPGGVYYPLGGTICRLFNLAAARHGLRCTEVPTAGSLANLAALRAGRIEVAIMQSDVQAEARLRHGPTPPFDDMRALFSAHAAAFTLVARGEARIAGIADLAGKRVALGARGTGLRAMANAVLAALDLPERGLGRVRASSPAVQNREFCARRLDAFITLADHPDGFIQDAALCGGTILDVGGEGIRTLLARRPEYVATVIPAGLYPGQAGEIATIGTTATVVTTRYLSDPAATEIARAVFDELDSFRLLHPAFADLRPEDMVARGLTAPLHPAVAAYYRARGWLH